MRQGAQLLGKFVEQRKTLRDPIRNFRAQRCDVLLEGSHFPFQSRQPLTRTVMEFQSQPPSFIVLRLQESVVQCAQDILRLLQFGGSLLDPRLQLCSGEHFLRNMHALEQYTQTKSVWVDLN